MIQKVSVIIPTYNCAQYITEAIESVLKQTYKDIEIVVIDDGSTDNTREVLKFYIENEKINYIYQDNQGPGAARNTGIKYAKGNYIAFLDADDTLTDDSIEKRLNIITCDPNIGLVFSELYYQPEESQIIKINLINKIRKYSSYMIKIPNGFLINGLFKDIFEVPFLIHTCTVLVRKQVFEKSGFFRTDIFIAEDRDMWLRIARHYKFGFVNIPLAYYKRYRSNLTVTDPFKYGMDRLSFLHNLLKIYRGEKKICKFIKKRLCIPYYDLAIYFYQKNMKIMFIRNITKSIYYNPWNCPPYRFFLLSLIPRKIRNMLKSIYGCFTNRIPNI